MDDRPLAPSPGFITSQDPVPSPAVEAERHRASLAFAGGQRLELLKSAVRAGESALKTLLLMNGGAAVAVLAFLGNLLAKPSSGLNLSVPNFKAGLLRFTLGVALVGVSATLRFIAIYAAMSKSRLELPCSWAALLAGLTSLVAFVLGGLWVVGAVW